MNRVSGVCGWCRHTGNSRTKVIAAGAELENFENGGNADFVAS